MCEDPPWEDKSDGWTTVPREWVSRQPSHWHLGILPTSERAVQYRRVLWSVVQLTLAGVVLDEKLFQSSPEMLFQSFLETFFWSYLGTFCWSFLVAFCRSFLVAFFWRLLRLEQSFTLRPATRFPVPLQRVHVGARTIPNSLADIPCTKMTVPYLLTKLNSLMSTTHTLQKPGLQRLLKHVLSNARDFGEAYGILCHWWLLRLGVSAALQSLKQRLRKISELRNGVI